MNPTCGPSSLTINCFQGTVIDNFRRKCLMVYLAAVELKNIGGTDYTGNLTGGASGALLGDAVAGLQQCTKDQLGYREVGLYELGIQHNNTVASGTPATDINTRMQQIKCLINVDERTLDMMLVWLTCNLGVHKSFPQ